VHMSGQIGGVRVMLSFQAINEGRGIQVCCDERGMTTLTALSDRRAVNVHAILTSFRG
jgi:hypothetical protein